VHHLIDVVDPDEKYSAGIYGQQARKAVRDIIARNRIPLIVGGSGLYIRALLEGFFKEQISDEGVRQVLKQRLTEEGSVSLFEELRRVDPVAAERLHPNDAQRIIRALEVFLITRRSLSEWQQDPSQPLEVDSLILGLALPRAWLYKRIEDRVDYMLKAGLIEEVERLVARGYTSELNALQTVGYREIFAYLQGEQPLDEATEMIKRNTRRYAKRQMTWFKRDERIHWLDCDLDRIQNLADYCIRLFNATA
jgi:tRNA dimethylallyltransferase